MPLSPQLGQYYAGQDPQDASLDLGLTLGSVVGMIGGPAKASESLSTLQKRMGVGKVTRQGGQWISSSRNIAFPTKWQAELDDIRDFMSALQRRMGR